jgi:hypothetical protein
MASASNTQISLEAFRGGAPIASAAFDGPAVTIGSGDGLMFRVEGEGVEAMHAVVNFEGGVLTVLDLGGGLVVDGQTVSNVALGSAGSVTLGDVEVRVRLTGGEAAGVSAPSAPPHAPNPVAVEAAPTEEHADAEDDEIEEHEDATDPGHDDHHDETPFEDAVAFVLRANPGTRMKDRAAVLEVVQVWGQLIVETRQFLREPRDIAIGERAGWRWNFLGVDMGFVPSGLHLVLPYLPPLWSEVRQDWKSDFYAPHASLPGESEYNFFRADADGYSAHVPKGWDAFVDVEDKRYTLDELVAAGKATAGDNGYKVAIGDDTRLVAGRDGIVFFAHQAHPVRRLVARSTGDSDGVFTALLGLGGFLFLMLLLLMSFAGPSLDSGMVEIPDRMVELLLEKPPEEKTKKPEANPDAGEGAKAKKEEGKVGKKEAKIEKAKGDKVELKKLEIDRKIAENAGVLGAMNNSDLDQIFGATGLSQDLKGGIGGLIGTVGTQFGSGGLGARGGGLGGGGTAEGLGGLGTKGIGSGASGYGSGGGNFGAKGEGGLGAVGGDPIILGALDRSLIDEVIKRHMNQIRYCYQRELTKNPALAGKIVIKFTIAKDGTVSTASSKTTTMNNAAVEQCIVGRFLRMQFPEPKGGGIVIVSYPFIFSPG